VHAALPPLRSLVECEAARDGQLREAETAGEAGESVAQPVLRYVGFLGALADAVQDADVPPGTVALCQVSITRRMRL